MNCCITELRCKEVINKADGCRLGLVSDVEVDTCTAQLCALVVFGRSRFLGLFGREEDIVIPWREIEIIGEETVLVNHPNLLPRSRRGGIFGGFLRR